MTNSSNQIPPDSYVPFKQYGCEIARASLPTGGFADKTSWSNGVANASSIRAVRERRQRSDS